MQFRSLLISSSCVALQEAYETLKNWSMTHTYPASVTSFNVGICQK